MFKIGELDKTIILQTQYETITGGNVIQSWDSGVTIRAKVTMIDGSIYVTDDELVGKTLYKIEFWDNNYPQTIRFLYGDLVLYPVRPMTKNPGSAFLTEVSVLTATKEGEVSESTTDDHIYYLYDTTVLSESSYLDEI